MSRFGIECVDRYSLSYVLDIQYILSKLFSDLYLNSELPRTQNIFTFDKWLLGWNWHPIVRLSYTPAHSSSLPCFLSLTIHTHTHTYFLLEKSCMSINNVIKVDICSHRHSTQYYIWVAECTIGPILVPLPHFSIKKSYSENSQPIQEVGQSISNHEVKNTKWPVFYVYIIFEKMSRVSI